ncbi:lipoate--protein ligase [Limosilactobacillus vaginalis]|jgi:lipoate-protein ligase A|uniref:lipoate--protein ligase n=1 Tax=Limosilactobacillus vaginalis DSM 5837 = ATCC 49540 TaxID=1423814 RepID=C2ESH5_9LACO|nr:lipoate--protein ligase [Limosilactobacillus vaginalis]EEJ41140.1 lipoyltransferase and lipoate-protein ligase [Limosilactobacillus vaginalis DSM 5837 = ATCC 49540]MCZ2465630.1 lipoate--protein ligase [Limosilactobacillus vaginalis]QFS34143.1 lipoate--protein ligase [Limosilactobacillus vaginalis]
MFFIDTSRNGKPVHDALVNQSLDNYLINDLRLKGHGLICYINQPSVIIGVNQNAYAEIDLPYLKEHQIELVRRSSGGGAVYHDFGNLVFENIVVGDTSKFGDFHAIGDPIVDALHDLGISSAEVSGRNDMTIDGKKFSGMAIVKGDNSYAAGGTVMFDLNMQNANEVLTPEQDKLASKGVKSVNARVTNIKPYLPEKYQHWTTEDFKEYLLCHMFGVDSMDQVETYHLTDHDWSIIDSRLDKQYRTDLWNYGHNPGFDNYVSKHFPIGTVSFNFNESNGVITSIKIYGDFFTTGDPAIIEHNLNGTKLDSSSLISSLKQSNLEANLGQISPEELADLILSRK